MEDVGGRCLFQEIDSYEDDSQGFFDLMTHLSFDPNQDYPNSNSVNAQSSHSNNDHRTTSYDELSSEQYRQSVIVKNNNMNSNHLNVDETSAEKVHRQIPFLTYLGKLWILAKPLNLNSIANFWTDLFKNDSKVGKLLCLILSLSIAWH